ncbi:protein of unknown function DUF21 [Beutenbergia cavernae DSM 12333]|uniref:CBS domain containing protein n=1 Tax=Beutenbergia cavernae (strain ATCC BAA-8 / DSM 12333 / CCUG 43141 / JCM 11478 / NBRC 16432 / NCIMB 13614 / HKI 0122) TaxID=471853 RepID=C5C465_BEUC1|nr:hemolysin family protein [Beutenbergia cavernae]ACQ79978.1 protein of unknown function DUF21 [Beutenbergia cavernae DSM 12333]
MTEVLLLLLAMALVAACGGFVAAEFSFITVGRAQVESAAERGDKRAAGVLVALRTLSTQLSGAQVGITVTNLAIGFLAEPAISELIRPLLERTDLSESAISTTAITIGLVAATVITMVFGELVPKNLAIARPMATARAVAGFQRGFTKAVAWPIRFFNGTANRILRAMGIEPQEELASARSAEELTALVRHSAKEGTLAHDTAELVERSLAFGDRRARDAMTPRSRMVTLAPDDPVSELIARSKATGHSRFPVVDVVEQDGHTEARVAGIVHVRAALSVPFERRTSTPVSSVLAPATFVPDSIELDELMDDLREGGLQMALLIDEFGSLAGLVTLEDLVEEIVGEVRDEHDYDEPEPARDGNGGWVLSGLMRIDEASDVVDCALPEDEAYDTLGGLVTTELGRFAEVGDTVVVDAKHVPGVPDRRIELEVLAIDARRVDTVHLAIVERDGDAAPAGGEEE